MNSPTNERMALSRTGATGSPRGLLDLLGGRLGGRIGGRIGWTRRPFLLTHEPGELISPDVGKKGAARADPRVSPRPRLAASREGFFRTPTRLRFERQGAIRTGPVRQVAGSTA